MAQRMAGDRIRERLIDKDAPMTHGGKGGTKGTFSRAASRAGMSVQEYARHVLADDNASPELKRKANFARNAASWKK